jgi:hypothetical protein
VLRVVDYSTGNASRQESRDHVSESVSDCGPSQFFTIGTPGFEPGVFRRFPKEFGHVSEDVSEIRKLTCLGEQARRETFVNSGRRRTSR